MNSLLEPDNLANRKALKKHLSSSLYTPRFNVSLAFERQIALERLSGNLLIFTLGVAKNGFISVLDFEKVKLKIN